MEVAVEYAKVGDAVEGMEWKEAGGCGPIVLRRSIAGRALTGGKQVFLGAERRIEEGEYDKGQVASGEVVWNTRNLVDVESWSRV